jgi:hypothetical protein
MDDQGEGFDTEWLGRRADVGHCAAHAEQSVPLGPMEPFITAAISFNPHPRTRHCHASRHVA